MSTQEPARPRVVRLDPLDLERSADDPGLAAMLADGWTVIAPLVTNRRGTSDPEVALVMAPPRRGYGRTERRTTWAWVGLAATAGLGVGAVTAWFLLVTS